MINIVNPGNFLPFYTDLRLQQRNFHQAGWGIKAHQKRLIPFCLPTTDTPDNIEWFLINIDEPGLTYDIETSVLNLFQDDDTSAFFIIYNGSPIFANVPCGKYYIKIVTDESVYYSEVIEIVSITSEETIGIVVKSCTTNAITLEFSDTLQDGISSQVVEYKESTSNTWVALTVGGVGNDEVTIADLNSKDAPLLIRRTVETGVGNRLQTLYRLSYFSVPVCDGDYSFVFVKNNNSYRNENLYELSISNTKSLNREIMYQTGYIQKAYLEAYFDFPQLERNQETIVNRNGQITISSAVTRERYRFRIPELPDTMIYPLQTIRDHDTVTIKRLSDGLTVTLQEPEFSFEQNEGEYFSKGLITFRTAKFFNNGCPQDLNLTLLGE